MTKRKNKSVEIISDPKRIKSMTVIATTIDFFKDSQDTEDIQNVCRINPEDVYSDFEDSDEDLTESETDSESETESEESSP